MTTVLEHKLSLIFVEKADEVKFLVIDMLKMRTPQELLTMEREIHDFFRRFADQLMAACLSGLINDKEYQEETMGIYRPLKLQGMGYRDVLILLIGGTFIRISTPYYVPKRCRKQGRPRGIGHRGEGGVGIWPMLDRLGIRDHATPLVRSEISRHTVMASSYEEAKRSLEAVGIRLDEKTIQRISRNFGREALKVRDKLISAREYETETSKLEFDGRTIVVSVDGGRTRIRIPRKRGRKKKGTGHHRFQAPWREPKVLAIYVIDERGKKDNAVLPICDGTFGDADAVFGMIVGYLRFIRASNAKRVIIIGDGAKWIWNRIEKLTTEAKLDPSSVIPIVDFYHAVEHLHKAGDLRKGWTTKERENWLRRQKRFLRAGDIEKLIDGFHPLLKGRLSKGIQTELEYFSKNKERMRYSQFEKLGLPIGSGVIESAVRRIVNLRLKGNGIFWLEEMAEVVLHLRAYCKSGRWNELVERTILPTVTSKLEKNYDVNEQLPMAA